MEVLITTCSKEKKLDAGLLPAAQRYISARIAQVMAIGKKRGKQVYILSGKYGLLKPEEEIEWYDKPLTAEDETTITGLVIRRLKDENAGRVTFHAERMDSPGWGSYYTVITKACDSLGIKLTVELVN